MDNLDLNGQLNDFDVFEQNIEEDEEIVSHKSGIKDPFKSLSDLQFIETYRLSKDLVKRVIHIVTPYMKASTRHKSMTIKQKVMAALRFLTSGDSPMEMAVCKLRQNLPFSKSRYLNCGKKKIRLYNLRQNR